MSYFLLHPCKKKLHRNFDQRIINIMHIFSLAKKTHKSTFLMQGNNYFFNQNPIQHFNTQIYIHTHSKKSQDILLRVCFGTLKTHSNQAWTNSLQSKLFGGFYFKKQCTKNGKNSIKFYDIIAKIKIVLFFFTQQAPFREKKNIKRLSQIALFHI